MKAKKLLVIGLLIISFSCSDNFKNPGEMLNKKIPLRDFFKNPDKSAFQISPDGKYLSYLAPYKNRKNIIVQEIGKKDSVRVTSETDRDISGYFWAKNDRILFLKDNGGDENYKLYGVDADGSNLKCLTDFDKVVTQIIDDLEDIPDEVIIGLNKRDKRVFDPYRLNIVTGQMTMLAENPGNISGWMTDHMGKLRIAMSVDGTKTSLLYRETEKDKFKTVITTDFKESLSPLFFTFDNKNIYAATNIGRDKSAIVEFDLKNAKEIRLIYENKEYDVDNLYYSRKEKVLTSTSYISWKSERYFFDEETKNMFENIKKQLPNYEISFISHTKAEDKYIIRTYSDRSLGAYYLFDKTNNNLTHICDISLWIKEKEMAEMKAVEYKTRDGLTIHGYLTLPNNIKPEKLSVVINPHGGPWVRDVWGYNPEVQFLANRGYAVLQINYRGSTGYGRKFHEAGYKQWGLKMQDDITDGVKWLIDQGIANYRKVAIYGGSYGGYATLAALAFTPDYYACGVDYVGVSNLFTFMKTIPEYWKPFLPMMYEMTGDPEKDSVQFKATSPALHADKIDAPLLIAQGANDPRVNKDESDQMVKALRKRGVQVEYMVKANEGHGFRNEENRFDFYEAMDSFLQKYIGYKVERNTNKKVKKFKVDGVI